MEAAGATLAELLADLERRYPGIRFRMIDEQDCIREHMRVVVKREPVFDLATALQPGDKVQILQALSGGAGATQCGRRGAPADRCARRRR